MLPARRARGPERIFDQVQDAISIGPLRDRHSYSRLLPLFRPTLGYGELGKHLDANRSLKRSAPAHLPLSLEAELGHHGALPGRGDALSGRGAWYGARPSHRIS